jgi:glycosyltransferase involved in cell wall biosynthesis
LSAWVYTVVRNEALLISYWLRHYATFCDRMIVYDDKSDDGTAEIATLGGAEVREYPGSGLDDMTFVALANERYKEARGEADWVIWVDGDEFLYHPRMIEQLAALKVAGVNLPTVNGYNMVADGPPTGSGQIYEEICTGFRHDRYDKPCILDPNLNLTWEVGKHAASAVEAVVTASDAPLKLLHYRYLGRAYHEARSAGNYRRLSVLNKASRFGFEVTPGWTGEFSVDWYERQPVEMCV